MNIASAENQGYRRRAASARIAAADSKNPHLREQFIKLAREWDRLAATAGSVDAQERIAEVMGLED